MKIKDICTLHTTSVNPQKDVLYCLYSLPSFDDNMKPEELFGKDIHSNKYAIPNRCILFNKLNVRFKRVWRIDNQNLNKLASTEFLPLVIDESKVDYQYCYYLLISERITKYLCGQNTNTSGSHKRIEPTDLMNIEITLPSMDIQKKIGKMLSDIDAKISLNKQINSNLEAYVRQIFEYWFLQFDFPDSNGRPYKSSGGEMIYNAQLKRDIPKGWEVKKIGDVAKTYSGGTPLASNKSYYTKGTIPWINSGELNETFITETPNFITELGYKNSSAKWYEEQTILIALYGATAGKVSFLSFPATSNQAVCGIMPHDKNTTHIIRHYLITLYSYFVSLSTGSARDNISQDIVRNIPIALPNEQNIIDAYHSLIEKHISLIIENKKQIASLTRQRDELLPLLMNGQVTVE